MLIGLSGKKRVGKDVVGHWLEVKHDFTRVSFATLLKKQATRLGWNGNKDERGRKLLQDLGMVARGYDENFWVDEVWREMLKIERKTGQENFVVTDVRFVNEARRIKEEGGIVVRITRTDEITDDSHPSETELDNYRFDYRITSIYGDLNALYRQVNEMIVKELNKHANEIEKNASVGV